MSLRPAVPTAQIDYGRKWYVMAATAMGIFLATIDGSIVNVALPTLEKELNTNFATVQWVVLSYLLTLSTLLLMVGRLADIHGKKRIYWWGFLVFTVGSVLCGLSFNIYVLIAMRVVQAAGAAMVLALGPAIVTEAFPDSERGTALGISGAIVSVGIIAGPTVGGVLLKQLSWHWIFFVNVPVGLLGMWMVWRYVPNVAPGGDPRFDYWGAFTLFVSMLTLLLGLTLGPEQGFGSWPILLLFSTSITFLVMFILIELRVPAPMIDLGLFRNTLFSVNLSTGLITFMAIAGMILLLTYYLQDMRMLDVQQAGLLLAVTPIALGLTSPISGAISDRINPRPVTLVGLLVMAIGYAAISTLDQQTSLIGYIVRLLPVGLGIGIFQSPNNSAVMGAAPRSQLGTASGLLAVTRTLGQTVGLALFGAIWAAWVQRSNSGDIAGGATEAPIPIQIAAMQNTYLLIAALMVVALVVAVWAAVHERRVETRTES